LTPLVPRHRVELRIGRLFFVQIGGQKADHVVMAGLNAMRAVSRNPVMLGGLRIGYDGGAEHRLVFDRTGGLVGFLDKTHR
jgi:hypothetical protein